MGMLSIIAGWTRLQLGDQRHLAPKIAGECVGTRGNHADMAPVPIVAVSPARAIECEAAALG